MRAVQIAELDLPHGSEREGERLTLPVSCRMVTRYLSAGRGGLGSPPVAFSLEVL